MDVSLLLKIAGVGFLTAVACQVLGRTGREEQVMAVSLAGIVTAVLLLIGQLSELIATIRGVFGF